MILAPRPRLLLLFALLALFVGGCRTPIGVKEVGFENVFAGLSRNVLDDGQPSAGSMQLLALLGLEDSYRKEPDKAIEAVRVYVLEEHLRGLFMLLAELEYSRGLQTADKRAFLEASMAAYFYLFCDELQPATNPYDPTFRLACDIYNRGLARSLQQESGEMRLRTQVLPTLHGSCEISASRPGFRWGEESFAHFLPADVFDVRGLKQRIRIPGLGVPLIALRNPQAAADPGEAHMARNLKLSATALLKFQLSLDAFASGRMRGDLELYHGAEETHVQIAEHEVPLEVDITTPLAYSLEESQIWGFSLLGFMKGSTKGYTPGVYMLQPYEPGKIPIVLVHGTASNPAVWTPLINGLMMDANLRNHYQFWLAIYNTGNPILYSTAEVRDSLRELVHSLDPDHKDPALAHIIVAGHSQGGLVTRLLVSSSGDTIWRSVAKKPFEEAPIENESDRELLRRCVFFEPLPFISRVVFISTPHRGSYVAGSWIGRIVRGLVTLPDQIQSFAKELLNRENLPPELKRGIPTSVDNMDPGSPFVQTIARLPMTPGLHIHSIIPVEGSGPIAEGEDGVVKYSSAHIEPVDSELVVHFSHSCQNEPPTIIELRRIMRLHLSEAQTWAAPKN